MAWEWEYGLGNIDIGVDYFNSVYEGKRSHGNPDGWGVWKSRSGNIDYGCWRCDYRHGDFVETDHQGNLQ